MKLRFYITAKGKFENIEVLSQQGCLTYIYKL